MSSQVTPLARRISVLFIAAMLIFVILIIRAFWVQVIMGGEYQQKAEQTETRLITLQPKRGNLYDRNNNLLVTSVPCYSAYADPKVIEDPTAAANKLAPFLDINKSELKKMLSSKKQFIWLKHGIDFKVGEKLRKMNLYGIGFIKSSKRIYLKGDMAANLLGFLGSDNQGLEGIESTFNRDLSGTPGQLLYLADAMGRQLPETKQLISPVNSGNHLELTIDQTIQFYVEEELNEIVAKYNPKRAVILVMNPNTGEILAMGNRPGFNPADWQSYPANTWGHNPATNFTYEPGSVFKIFVTAAALETGLVKPQQYFYDPGYIVVQGRKIYDSEKRDFGGVTFEKGLADSLNVVFVQVAQRLGTNELYKYIKGFGFGSPTGINLPGDEPGLIIPEKDVTPLGLAEISFGQAISTTPLQILTAACAIGNGGNLLKPYVVKAVKNPSGKTIKESIPQTVRQVISKATAQEVLKLMESAVVSGTGKNAAINGYSVAGKTGTAEVPGPGGYLPGKYVSSFVGFAPATKPQVGVLVMVDQPHNDYYGGTVAAPTFSDLVGKILNYWGVPHETPVTAAVEKNPKPDSKIIVPNIVNLPVSDARWLLENSGLQCYAPAKNGIVVAQKPKAGESLRPGSVVSLKLVSKEAAVLVLPELKGMTIKKASLILQELGLKIKVVGSGTAVSQSPEFGTVVAPNSTVTVNFK